ncbi:hypothetical protein P152DRAFT_472570 [Eremomyces bilateralis CBS 781.70]|uniref:Uncharacterized protein n=1 Tax=Eremomyces bilateralis CBS 781.70 TaxID=1392243 RepID=A0A6G1G775_9PEZI|nr:uncharacterized protein P152DRAFT_472570 [Eremomyces bilateralis CBS 781.70]KAF1813750.1 hypothetical protein P152DRAFT_472570 [Eremomyces bilateralis CBS 781.70]
MGKKRRQSDIAERQPTMPSVIPEEGIDAAPDSSWISPEEAACVTSQPRHQVPQDFLFVESMTTEPSTGTGNSSSKKGRRDIRSFVMQKARRNKSWSTSKKMIPSPAASGLLKYGTGEESVASLGQTDELTYPRPLTIQPLADTFGSFSPPRIGDQSGGNAELAAPDEAAMGYDIDLGWGLGLVGSRSPTARLAGSQEPGKSLTRQNNQLQCEECKNQAPQWMDLYATCPRCESFESRIIHRLPPQQRFMFTAFDPFNTLPIHVDEKVVGMMEHFLYVLIPQSIPLDIHRKSDVLKTTWLAMALTSRAFLHSLLCAISLHLYLVGSTDVRYVDIVYHKGRAVAEVNANLSDPAAAISDANIGAVWNLLCVEESFLLPLWQRDSDFLNDLRQHHPEPDTAALGVNTGTAACVVGSNNNSRIIHHNGLMRMLELRGGITGLQTNRCLQAFIFWHAMTNAIASFHLPPLYPILLFEQPTPALVSRYQRYDHDHGLDHVLSVLRSSPWNGLPKELVRITRSLYFLTIDLNDWFSSHSPFSNILDPLDLQTRAVHIESCLLQLLDTSSLGPPSAGTPSDPDTASTSIGLLHDAYAIALLIFTVWVSENLSNQPNNVLQFTAIPRLQRELVLSSSTASQQQNAPFWPPPSQSTQERISESQGPQLNASSGDVRLWILLIGAICSSRSSEGTWFRSELQHGCHDAGLYDVEELLSRCRRFLWVEFKLTAAARGIWRWIVND